MRVLVTIGVMAIEGMVVVAYLGLGAVAGVLAGLLGVGGGLVIVPALFFLFGALGFSEQIVMHLALGSSLATVAFTALASSYAHHKHGAVLWRVVAVLVPGIALGAFGGAAVADRLPTPALRLAFGLFELLVAAQLGFGVRASPQRGLPRRAGMIGVGTLIGALSAVFGIGGGTLTVPFLVWCNVRIRVAVATSAACGLPIALAGSLGFITAGWDNPKLPAGASGYVYWPAVLGIAAASVPCAPLGARLTHALPMETLQRLFAILLAFIGLRMLI
ncbi:MAG: sulfite exporter TauE/SafE family protein [Gammaproteobacteria bacterium]